MSSIEGEREKKRETHSMLGIISAARSCALLLSWEKRSLSWLEPEAARPGSAESEDAMLRLRLRLSVLVLVLTVETVAVVGLRLRRAEDELERRFACECECGCDEDDGDRYEGSVLAAKVCWGEKASAGGGGWW